MRSMHLREQAGAGQGLSSESLHTPRVWPQAGWAAACLAQRLITVGCGRSILPLKFQCCAVNSRAVD